MAKVGVRWAIQSNTFQEGKGNNVSNQNLHFEQVTDNRGYWYNFATKAHEYIETPEDFTNYIPQQPAAQGLYQLYIEMGETPTEAAIKVYTACVGEVRE